VTPVQRVLITGGAGFIGGAVVRLMVGKGYDIVNLDKLTYAGNLQSVREVSGLPNYRFYQADICDRRAVGEILDREQPDAIMHLAAESHVDRSIDGPAEFVQTNVVGTFALLDAVLTYFNGLDRDRRDRFRFHHISTDEVFGALGLDQPPFDEDSLYAPSSPYSASKAAADHLVRAWHTTYGLPVVLSNCSNNYGPYHFPEKLIPLIILNAVDGKPLPVYGKGENVRDWLFVEDHANALEAIVTRGRIGESYNVGGRSERSNLSVVETICDILDRRRPLGNERGRRELIRFVPDRPGHDLRYAIDCSKVERELDWRAAEHFESGLEKTVDWFLQNDWWWRPLREQKYAGERLGIRQ
jgi:dTDP-glucose 4,6-dehydratase